MEADEALEDAVACQPSIAGWCRGDGEHEVEVEVFLFFELRCVALLRWVVPNETSRAGGRLLEGGSWWSTRL